MGESSWPGGAGGRPGVGWGGPAGERGRGGAPQPRGEPIVVDRDEHPRADTSAEALVRLKAAFRAGGSVTAGDSSGINDRARAPGGLGGGGARAAGAEAP